MRVYRMRLRKFIPLENVPDAQVNESHFYTDPNLFDEPEFFHDETPQVTSATVAFSSDPAESDHETPREIIILEPEITKTPAIDNCAHTTTSPQESQQDPVVNLPPEISNGLQPELRTSPDEEENHDASTPEVTQTEVTPISDDVQREAPEQLIDLINLVNQSLDHPALATIYVTTQHHAFTKIS